jgi:hypothetical protein
MITDRDIAIRGVAEGKGPDAKVRDAMSPEVKYCFEDEDVTHVAENMNRDKRLVGIVSLADLATEGSVAKTAKALTAFRNRAANTTRVLDNHMVSRERGISPGRTTLSLPLGPGPASKFKLRPAVLRKVRGPFLFAVMGLAPSKG